MLGLLWAAANSAHAFTREVYVWQRQFTPAVYQAMEALRDDTDGCAVLAAEVSWEKDGPRLFRSTVNYPALAAAGRPVGLVLRIGPYAGLFSADDATASYLAGVATSVLQASRSRGLEPAELQVDFDCPSSKLGGFRLWLDALRNAREGTKIAFTALPDWLARKEFSSLAHAADGFILQVHSLEKPGGPDELFQLCDPDRAWKWIERAGRVGVPFRVALPTYGYQLAFDTTGKFVALSAEGAPAAGPPGSQIRTVRSDVATISRLARKISAIKPRGCTGIIWFRLPVADDRLNWNITTLKVVLRDELPVSQLAVTVAWLKDGLAEVELVNRGEQDESLPPKVTVRWSHDFKMIMADGLGSYSLSMDRTDDGMLVLTAESAADGERIAPGHSRKIGWLRFPHEIPLALQIVARS